MKHEHLRWASLLSMFVALLAGPALADALPEKTAADDETWYVLMLQGQRAGYAHQLESRDDQRITTEMDMQLSIKRGMFPMQISQSTRFIETVQGEPIRAESSMSLGTQPQTTEYRFTDAGIELLSPDGEVAKTLPPIEGDWMTPAETQCYVEQQIDEGAERIEVRTIDVSMGVNAVELVMTRVGEQQIEAMGKTVPAIVWETENSMTPGIKSREYLDEDGRMLKTTIRFGPGLEMQMIEADKALAQSPVDPPELLASLMIHPAAGGSRLDEPRHTRAAAYELTIEREDDAPAIELPRTSIQQVVWDGPASATVLVDMDDPQPVEPDAVGDQYLAATEVVDHEDERVRELVDEALGANAMTDRAKALRLRQFVADYIDEKNLSVGFATADQVARTGEGDCTEHAVLLAAMLRAAGIPSRTVSGLIYVDRFIDRQDVFGYHMWTQAWIENEQDEQGGSGVWLDLDAVMAPDGAAFDAAHIALATSSLGDDSFNDMVRLAPLFGALKIKVISAE